MKKFIFSTILLIVIMSLAGCSKKDINITAEDIVTDTFLIKRNGQLQVATVEDFSKEYYSLNDLEEFIKKQINSYNKEVGMEAVTVTELSLQNGKAVMMLGYTEMKHYSEFNRVTAAYFSADTKNVALTLPDHYVSAKSGAKVDRATAMKNNKNRVLVIYEPYEIIVDGTIRYYSENATLNESNVAISSDEEATIIIYTPEN